MNKFSLLLICILLPLVTVWAQTPIENADFEEWNEDTGGNYVEPEGYWATLNAVSKLFPIAPVTAFRETELVQAGNFAVKLESKNFLVAPIGGLLATAFFDTQVTDPTTALKTGQPFTDRPERFTGWYHYLPEADDSATIGLELSKWIDGEHVIIGEAGLFVHETSEYNSYDLEIEYFSDETPDSILIVFGSSAGAEDFNIHAGSTLYIDNINLVYETESGLSIADGDRYVKLFPNPARDRVQLKINDWKGLGNLKVYDQQGRILLEDDIKENTYSISVQDWPAGAYIYKYHSPSGREESGQFIVSQK